MQAEMSDPNTVRQSTGIGGVNAGPQDEQEAIQKMGKSFNEGRREHFFHIWLRVMPVQLR